MSGKMMPFHAHPLSFDRFQSFPCDFCYERGGVFFYCDKCRYQAARSCWVHKECWTRDSVYYRHGELVPEHHHPILCKDFKTYVCCFCNESTRKGYQCNDCSFAVHKSCLDSFNNLLICKHSLKIYMRGSLEYPADQCHFCKGNLSGDTFFFHCSICNISVDKRCMTSPERRPLTLHNPKNHEHTLTLFQRLVNFTCNGCALEGDRNPYVCIECNIMMHKDCVDLPRVIIINRHDHRISHSSHLGYGDWDCGVCRQKIDWVYGAFSCSRCPGYAVHAKCATRSDVWDGKELEDEPEEEEDEDPFKVINENEIIHFLHEDHHLKLHEDYSTGQDNFRCNCCLVSVNDGPFYKCVACNFYLHKACASLPRRKRHFLHNLQLTLQSGDHEEGDGFCCSACRQDSTGFRYNEHWKSFDTRCISVPEPFRHDLHPHPLYYTSTKKATCQGCGTYSEYILNCIVCEYTLCIKCATLPRKVKNRCDDHFLSLCHGAGNASGDLWCDICEKKTDPSVWYYTCDKCGTTLHVDCVLGDSYYMKRVSGDKLPIVPNKGLSRPICSVCQGRCRFPFLVKNNYSMVYYCSMVCFYKKKW